MRKKKEPEMETLMMPGDEQGVAQAARLLTMGALVGIPTETVYGLAANARDKQAVASIFTAKGRPQDNPLIVHIALMKELYDVAVNVPPQAKQLAAAFWPGPLTMILPRSREIPPIVSAGLDTVAVRMPSHPVAHALLLACGLPLAAPSGNLSGQPSPTTASHMYEHMRGRIPLILDGGACAVGVESTVITLCGPRPMVLRPGAVTPEQLSKVLGQPVALSRAITSGLRPGESAQSPGMKYQHYAPKAQITVLMGSSVDYASYVNTHLRPGRIALCFEEDVPALRVPYVTYGSARDAAGQARQLFSALRRLDEVGADTVLAHCPQKTGVGLAVYNRLLRAAAFRLVQV